MFSCHTKDPGLHKRCKSNGRNWTAKSTHPQQKDDILMSVESVLAQQKKLRGESAESFLNNLSLARICNEVMYSPLGTSTELMNRVEDFGVPNGDADFNVASSTDNEVEPIMYDAEPMAAGSDDEYKEVGIEVEVEQVRMGWI